VRGEFIADDRREVGESSLGESLGPDDVEFERSFFENNPIVSQCQGVEAMPNGIKDGRMGLKKSGHGRWE
jgi:hypothetical protein